MSAKIKQPGFYYVGLKDEQHGGYRVVGLELDDRPHAGMEICLGQVLQMVSKQGKFRLPVFKSGVKVRLLAHTGLAKFSVKGIEANSAPIYRIQILEN
ncbi:MAG: hypothetical protein ACOZAO_05185 [Patescibacteria group bacterium]